jgi:hypothetical protein
MLQFNKYLEIIQESKKPIFINISRQLIKNKKKLTVKKGKIKELSKNEENFEKLSNFSYLMNDEFILVKFNDIFYLYKVINSNLDNLFIRYAAENKDLKDLI